MNTSYNAVGGALSLWRSTDREVVIAGSVGTGKSRADLEKAHYWCLRYPGVRVAFARKTRVSMTNTMLVTFETHVAPGFFPEGGAKRANRKEYTYPNGSEIDLIGLDNVERIQSSEYDLIVIGEVTDGVLESDWELCSGRLRNGKGPYHQIVGDCNPSAPSHWILKRAKEGRLKLIQSVIQDNPRFYDARVGEFTQEGLEYYGELERTYTGHRLDRYLKGLWVSPEGARWELDRDVHGFRMKQRFPEGLPRHFRLRMGLDYGLAAPYCSLWMGMDYNGDVYVFREDYEALLKAWEQIERVKQLTAFNERIDEVKADPNCWSKFPGHQGTTDITVATYYERGLRDDPRFGPLVPGYKGERIHPLTTLDNYISRNNGHPDLYIEERCTNLWRELTEMVWDPRGDKEEVIGDDHAVTALYYALHTHITAPAPPREEVTAEVVTQKWNEERYERDIRESLRRSGATGRRLRV